MAKATPQQIQAFVTANIDNPQAIADAAAQYGVSTTDLASAMNVDVGTVNNFFSGANVAPPAPTFVAGTAPGTVGVSYGQASGDLIAQVQQQNPELATALQAGTASLNGDANTGTYNLINTQTGLVIGGNYQVQVNPSGVGINIPTASGAVVQASVTPDQSGAIAPVKASQVFNTGLLAGAGGFAGGADVAKDAVAIGLAYALPIAGEYISASLSTAAFAVPTYVGTALASISLNIAQGQTLEEAIKNSAPSLLSAGIMDQTGLSKLSVDITSNPQYQNVINNMAGSFIATAAKGGTFNDVLTNAAAAGGGTLIGNALQTDGVSASNAQAVGNAIAANITTGSTVSGAIAGAGSLGGSQAKLNAITSQFPNMIPTQTKDGTVGYFDPKTSITYNTDGTVLAAAPGAPGPGVKIAGNQPSTPQSLTVVAPSGGVSSFQMPGQAKIYLYDVIDNQGNSYTLQTTQKLNDGAVVSPNIGDLTASSGQGTSGVTATDAPTLPSGTPAPVTQALLQIGGLLGLGTSDPNSVYAALYGAGATGGAGQYAIIGLDTDTKQSIQDILNNTTFPDPNVQATIANSLTKTPTTPTNQVQSKTTTTNAGGAAGTPGGGGGSGTPGLGGGSPSPSGSTAGGAATFPGDLSISNTVGGTGLTGPGTGTTGTTGVGPVGTGLQGTVNTALGLQNFGSTGVLTGSSGTEKNGTGGAGTVRGGGAGSTGATGLGPETRPGTDGLVDTGTGTGVRGTTGIGPGTRPGIGDLGTGPTVIDPLIDPLKNPSIDTEPPTTVDPPTDISVISNYVKPKKLPGVLPSILGPAQPITGVTQGLGGYGGGTSVESGGPQQAVWNVQSLKLKEDGTPDYGSLSSALGI